jgi:protein involved in polysaccharide export with SLBB domain
MAARSGKPGRRHGRLVLQAVIVLVFAGCSAGPGKSLALFSQGHPLLEEAQALRESNPEPSVPRELDRHVQPPYVVEPGDVLLVHPVDLESPVRLPGDQPVLPDGTIHLGLYGPLPVAGLTLDEIERAVNALVQAKTPKAGLVTVRLIARQSKFFYVLGEVSAPGAFPFTGRETVLDGILAAGGLTECAGRQDIILSRPTGPHECRVVLPVCYPRIVQLGDTTTNYRLAPGDRIYVPSRGHKGLLPCGAGKNPCAGPCPPAPCVSAAPTERGACPEPAPALGIPVPLGQAAEEIAWRPIPRRYGR